MFLLGLHKLGKGDWRGISRNYVISRTPTQVASHAQKHFIRQSNVSRRKRRSSLFDIVADEVSTLSLRVIPQLSYLTCMNNKFESVVFNWLFEPLTEIISIDMARMDIPLRFLFLPVKILLVYYQNLSLVRLLCLKNTTFSINTLFCNCIKMGYCSCSFFNALLFFLVCV